MTNENSWFRRRNVLKTLGAGIAVGTVMAGTTSADGKPLPREAPDGRFIYATWGDGGIWEIFDAEPSVHFPEEPDFEEPRTIDSEGDDNAHEPLYLIKPIAGAEHSPHIPAPPTFPGPFVGIDHTVPVPGGTDKQYSAQWHPKFVVDATQPFICVAFCDPDAEEDPVMFPNLVNQDQNGDDLTSSTKIEAATNVAILPAPEDAVFTCPVRPHNPRGD